MLNTGPAPCERGGPFDPVCVSFSTVPSQRDSNTFNERPEGLLGSRMPDDVEDKASAHDEGDVGRLQAIAGYSKERMRVASVDISA